MAKAESTVGSSLPDLNIEFMRSLVKQYSELGQWSSALFWADAAAGAGAAANGGVASGDDVWLLASTMLARGELHRAAHAVTSRGLHRRHLLCLGVAMRAYVSAKEPAVALSLMEECDPMLLEPRSTDQTHNRALAGALVWQATALAALERRGAAAGALGAALRADAACVEALDLLLGQHALTPSQETALVESLPIGSQLGSAEGALVRAAYRERLRRYRPAERGAPPDDGVPPEVESALALTADAAICRARRLAAACEWADALKLLDSLDPWSCAEVRVACLVELRRTSQLFAFAHALVDAYPHAWQAWYAVGCYYYLVGKSEFARRYLSKACSASGGGGGGGGGGVSGAAGCVWLAYGHCFAADAEHDQAIHAYFKASQLMPGCSIPPLYVGVQCALLNNTSMCERFLLRAAHLYNDQNSAEVSGAGEAGEAGGEAGGCGWDQLAGVVRSPHVAHEAGCAALGGGQPLAAKRLLDAALEHARGADGEVSARWAPTLDAMGHACRQLGQPAEALQWHERALALRPGRASTYAAMGLCLALLGREGEAADALHSALAKDPDDVVSLALLDAIVDRLDNGLTEEEIPQFPFPAVTLSLPAESPPAAGPPGARGVAGGGGGGEDGGGGGDAGDNTNISDMSMSFD